LRVYVLVRDSLRVCVLVRDSLRVCELDYDSSHVCELDYGCDCDYGLFVALHYNIETFPCIVECVW
jgi:hypothetical protein